MCLFDFTSILDSTGKVVVRYIYDAWGNHAVVDNSGNAVTSGIGALNPFRYRGYYYDVETGLYYLKTRYYDPETGRFITIDGISYLDPESINGLNLYAYCANNPVMYTDPEGTKKLKWWQWLIGIVAVIALVAVTVAFVASAIVTGGATLVALGVGFAIGASANLIGQGVTNVLNGKGFFEDINWGSVIIGGVAGIAFATGVGGIFGAFAIGALSKTAMAAFQGESLSSIIYSGIMGGLSAAAGYMLGQVIGNKLNNGNDYGFGDFFNAARIDGAGVIGAGLKAFGSAWYKFLPPITQGMSRGGLNTFFKWIRKFFND